MRVDLHNHTTLCNHATGSMEDYIKKAIELGIDIYGFSDHAPMEFDKKYRMSLSQKDGYEKSVLELKDKYKDSIDIVLGYEVDFLDDDRYIEESILKSNVDYLIGSVHFINQWGFDNPEFIGEYKNKDIDKIWIDYFEAIESMAKSGYFDIVGHLDLIKVFNFLPKKDIKSIAKDAIKAIKASNMTIELNSAGYRKPIGQSYPSKELLELAFEFGIDITFGSDAHSVDQVGLYYDDITRLAKSVGYKECVYFKNKEKYKTIF